jgi:hypothetical protein
VREGPCVAPQCKDRDKSSGQWQFVPEPFATANGIKGKCVCKKADCLRWCGLKDAAQKPGRKQLKRLLAEEDGASIGVGRVVGERTPCPPFIISIDEIWGVR